MRYGELYWAKPDPSVGTEQSGRRPVLVVSSDDAIEAIPSVVATIPVTTRDRGWGTHVRITGAATGLTHPSWGLCEQVRTISTQRLASRLGAADANALASVAQVLRYLLNL